jgi:hypothetical protein
LHRRAQKVVRSERQRRVEEEEHRVKAARASGLAAPVVAALLTCGLVPAAAHGACGASTPSGAVNYAESATDAEPGAPDVSTVNNALDGSCTLRTETLLSPLHLEPGQHLIVQYDRDDPTSGPTAEQVDVLVFVDAARAVLQDGVNPPVALPTFGQYGFAVTLDQLGLTRSPTSLGVSVAGVHDPTPGVPGDEAYDRAPDVNLPMHRVPVRFTAPVPPVPPPPVAPAAKKPKSCVVPKVKRLIVRKAKRALKRAGCKYKVKGRGRVRWTSPRAGTRTIKTVRVRAKRTPRKKS